MASTTLGQVETALKADALAAFAHAMQATCGGSKRILVAVDSSHHVIFQLLASGAGGKEFYDSLHVMKLTAVNTTRSDADPRTIHRQLRACGHSLGVPGTGAAAMTVVFIVPPSPTVAKVIADTVRQHESCSWVVLWLPAATAECSMEMERQGVAGFVTQRDLSLGLLPMDPQVASLCHDAVFAELYVKGDHRALTEVVKGVFSLEKHMGRPMTDVTAHGVFATRVQRLLQQAQRRHRNRIQVTRAGNPQKLILIDRLQDPLSMLLTPMTYEGLLDALVGVNHGVVAYEKDQEAESTGRRSSITSATTTTTQTVLLNHLDPLYSEIRDVNFNVLIAKRMPLIAQELVSEVRSGPTGESERPSTTSSLAHVTAMLQKVPDLVKKKRSLVHHLQLVQQIRQLSAQYELRGCVETEMLIMSAGKSSSSSAAKDVDRFLEESIVRDPPMNLYDALKLVCLCSLVRGGLKADKLQWYRRQFCHTYGYQVLPLLVQLEKLDLIGTNHQTFDFPHLKRQLALIRGILDDDDTENPKDIQFMFPYTGYAPMSVRRIQDTLGMKYKTSALSGLASGSSSSSASIVSAASGASGNSNGSSNQVAMRTHVLVYYIGGVTVAELAAYRYLNQTQSQFEFFVAATSICNGQRLLRAI